MVVGWERGPGEDACAVECRRGGLFRGPLEPMTPASTPPAGSDPPEDEGAVASPGIHLSTFTHEGRFWDAHLEFVRDPPDSESCRARLCFVPSDRAENEEPARTAVIFIEPTRRDALRAAHALHPHNLVAMLRSVT